jgi:hypothetical protein
LYIVVSRSVRRTALVNVKGYALLVTHPVYFWTFIGTSTTVVKPDGTLATSDADLLTTENSLFADRRAPSAVTKTINIPPDFGVSFINNSALAEDTGTAISQVLFVERGINPNSVPLGTVVEVQWQDGTTARFTRIAIMGSLQWGYVPGTARDKKGNPIDATGKVIPNPNSAPSSPTGLPISPSTFGSSGLEYIIVTPNASPQVSITIEELPGDYITETTYMPPGG